MKGTCAIFIILGAILFGVAIGQQFDFDSMTDIASTLAIDVDSQIINGLMEDDDFLYTVTLSPMYMTKVNKSAMAILNNRFETNSGFFISNDTTQSNILCDEHIYVMGQATVYRVPVDNFSAFDQLVFPEDINPVASFCNENANGEKLLNFASYGTDTPQFYRVNLDSFDIASVVSFPLPNTGDYQTAVGNDTTAYLGIFSGFFYQLDLETSALTLNFSTQGMSVSSLQVDTARNTLYFCGDDWNSKGPYFVKIALDKVSNGAVLNIPRDPTYTNRTQINTDSGVSATFVGTSAESVCKGFSLDTERDQAIVYEFNPATTSSRLYRINTKTMETIETHTSRLASYSPKPVAGTINTEEQLFYYVTESDLVSVFYPANNSVIPPPVDPPFVAPVGFGRMTLIATADVVTNSLDMLNGAVEDDDFLYVYTLSPIKLAKINKTELALPNNTFAANLIGLESSIGQAALTGLHVKGHIYLFGQSTIFKVRTSGYLSLPETFNFPVDVNPVTSFYSKELFGEETLNFPNYGLETNLFYQVPLDLFNRSTYRTSPLPEGDFVVSAFNGTIDLYLGTFTGSFYLLNMEVWYTLKNFNVSSMTVTSLRVDWKRNTLYFCGEYAFSKGPYLVKINLEKVSNGALLTVPRDPSFTNRTQIDSDSGVSATFVGTAAESICKGFSLDTERDQAIVYEYNPMASSGRLYRINTWTMEVIDELAISTPFSQKPVTGLINTEEQLLYLLTEHQVMSVYYPASNDPVEPLTPSLEPVSAPPSEVPFFSIPIASAGHFVAGNVALLATLALSVL